jgi:SAM-dependent methyltransferase
VPDIDWSLSSTDYARHRRGFPPAFFDRLVARGLALPGHRALDLGTGTGSIARGLAQRGAQVVALDVAEGQLREAARLSELEGIADHIRFAHAPAEATGLAPSAFDLVLAGQCWHWFDRPRAAKETERVLAPGGHVVIAHFDFLPRAKVVARTFDLVRAHLHADASPEGPFGTESLYPEWLVDLSDAGFVELETFSFDLDDPYTHAGWRGRMRASQWMIRAEPQARERFDDALGACLAAEFPGDLLVPHRVFAVIARRAPHVSGAGVR